MYSFSNATWRTTRAVWRSDQWRDARAIGPGTMVFREGTSAGAFYQVVEGTLRATRILSDGRRQVLMFLHPGDTLGLGHGSTYVFDCEAITRSVLRRIPLPRSCETCRELLPDALADIRGLQLLLQLCNRRSAMEKVAAFLALLSERAGRSNSGVIDMPMGRADIADHLSLSIETISRCLTKLSANGTIELCTRRSFRVLSPTALCELGHMPDSYLGDREIREAARVERRPWPVCDERCSTPEEG